MRGPKRLRMTPATGIALVALFFALGGSAFAVGERFQAGAANQQRCANGAVRGVAHVTGDPSKGIANVPDQFAATRVLFARTFNCTNRAVQVRRTGIGTYEVRFVGNAAPTAFGAGAGTSTATATRIAPGTFRVSVYPPGIQDPADLPFVVVLV